MSPQLFVAFLPDPSWLRLLVFAGDDDITMCVNDQDLTRSPTMMVAETAWVGASEDIYVE